MKNSENILFFYVLVIFTGLISACEQSVPKDMMFCKAKEVYVLDNPFDEKTAKIVIYRGDEVKLTGDTVYHAAIDSTKKDSSDFAVRVIAKRGVIGWVHIKELQKERIGNISTKSKVQKSEAAVKPEVVIKDSIDVVDSLKTEGKDVSPNKLSEKDSIGTESKNLQKE